jgi:hypothetical protein
VCEEVRCGAGGGVVGGVVSASVHMLVAGAICACSPYTYTTAGCGRIPGWMTRTPHPGVLGLGAGGWGDESISKFNTQHQCQ